MRAFGSLHPDAWDVLEFDFAPQMLPGETLTWPPIITVVEATERDATPEAVLAGGNSLDPTSTKALVPVKGRVDGCDYLITVEIYTSDPRKRFVLPAVLPIRSDPQS